MVTTRWDRLSLAAGILIAPLFHARHFVSRNAPADSDPIGRFMSFYATHGTTQKIADYLALIAVSVFVVFLAGLRQRLEQGEGTGYPLGVLPSVALAAGLVWSPLMMLSSGTDLMLAWKDAAANPATFQAVRDVGYYLYEVAALPLAVCLAASSVASLSAGSFPRWVGWVGLATALCFVLASLLPFTSAGEVGDGLSFLLFLIWTLAAGITGLRHPVAQSQESRMMGSRVSVG
jgi:hypothetical protein